MRAHIAGIAALIQTGFPDGIHVYDTQAERPDYNPSDWSGSWSNENKAAWTLPARYIVLGAPTLREVSLSLSRACLDVDDLVYLKGCGTSVTSCRWVMEHMRAVADRGRPEVENYSTHLTLFGTPGMTDVDRDVKPHIAHATDTFHYRATLA